ncbi:MAG: DUF2764 family protein [Bacteroidaceae bacterium]|nr:DUF2764 family protein [Bacteroidaceae bacterium]
MSDYHYLVAGLPDIAFDGSKVTFTIDDFKESVYPSLSSADAKCVDLFFLAWDNENIMKLLREGSEAELERLGCYNKEELLEIIASAKNGDPRNGKIPAYLYNFLEYYYGNEQMASAMLSDILSAYYYEYATASSNKFIADWFTFNMNVNNLLVAMLARKYKLGVADVVVGSNEVAEALRSSAARDFGLSSTLDYVETVQRLSENDRLQERERQLDEMRWQWLEENSVFNYFTIEPLFVFLQKLDIVARWAKLDSDKGMQRYTELIDNLKGGLELPA